MSVTAKPILFSAPMVRAILEGRKIMTRRILKPAKPLTIDESVKVADQEPAPDGIGTIYHLPLDKLAMPYSPGMLLWVREAWRTESRAYDDLAPADMDADYPVLYDADADWSLNKSTGRARQVRHMPRWASRLTLKVSAVKVERLQDISEEDAKAEGIYERSAVGDDAAHDTWTWQPAGWRHGTPRAAFAALWTTLHGPISWGINPWIAAISFEVINRNVDDVIREAGG